MKSIIILLQFVILLWHRINGEYPPCSSCNVQQLYKDKPIGKENNQWCIIDKNNCKNENNQSSQNEINYTTSNLISNVGNTTNSNSTSNITSLDIITCPDCTILTENNEIGEYWGYIPEINRPCKIDNVKCKEVIKRKLEKPVLRGSDGSRICQSCDSIKVTDKIKSLMWGSEDGEECRIITSRCPQHKISGHPFCNGCNIQGTGTDFCLFGYENNQPCIINEVLCGTPENRFKRIYSDGTVLKGDGNTFDDDENNG
ncbi:hypothetical protein LY90DRAFT_667051 [Neocallimastix californiae]|uniref:CBM10 domain-containing protein n=1 Tax=Neocallimastix californiae TaxID=1754190 RepID=A0A1Y2EN98_9FUNG|nr:hypothetical protein LY90DRAFT_667051 [Neocallimastix californiae]|eukprot:ORY72706.1 hypothetical protein LY90DRAFT_667051 [Neocallimastix californiae]